MFKQFAQGLRACCCLAAYGLLPSLGWAHVDLDSPNGGEMLVGGSSFTIEWHPRIEHNTIDWDLWYSTTSADGPWEEIAMDIELGDPAKDSVHTFDWSLPNLDIPTAWVRVRQDNVDTDYFDVSESSFLVMAPTLGGGDFTGDGSVDGEDLDAWEEGFGLNSTAAPTEGDADLDRDVDGADFLAWQRELDGVSAAAVVSTVPEPAASILLLLGMIFLLWRK